MILDQSFLRKLANSPEFETRRSINEHFDESKKYDLFISHSFLDKDLIQVLVSLFEMDGYSVYVDWINDPGLNRSNVTPTTAKIVKDRVKQCQGLSYIATQNISNSKWCPWELGIGDGIHNGKACILPVLKESSTSFKGQEYLGMYPYIDYSNEREYSSSFHFFINSPQNKYKYISLRDWLNG